MSYQFGGLRKRKPHTIMLQMRTLKGLQKRKPSFMKALTGTCTTCDTCGICEQSISASVVCITRFTPVYLYVGGFCLLKREPGVCDK